MFFQRPLGLERLITFFSFEPKNCVCTQFLPWPVLSANTHATSECYLFTQFVHTRSRIANTFCAFLCPVGIITPGSARNEDNDNLYWRRIKSWRHRSGGIYRRKLGTIERTESERDETRRMGPRGCGETDIDKAFSITSTGRDERRPLKIVLFITRLASSDEITGNQRMPTYYK